MPAPTTAPESIDRHPGLQPLSPAPPPGRLPCRQSSALCLLAEMFFPVLVLCFPPPSGIGKGRRGRPRVCPHSCTRFCCTRRFFWLARFHDFRSGATLFVV